MAIEPGATFRDTTANPHLWIVVAGPDAASKVIIVNLTSVKGRDDRTTVCGVGEHPFIQRQSVVAYKYAMHVETVQLESELAHGTIIRNDDCSPDFLKKVADGLLVSDSTPLGIANAYVAILREQ